MKRLALVIALAGCGGARSPGSAVVFEGELDWRVQVNDGASTDTRCVVAGKRALCTSPLLGSVLVTAIDSGSRKVCMRSGSDAPTVQSLDAPPPDWAVKVRSKVDAAMAQFGPYEATGNERAIAGRRCDEWQRRANNGNESATWTVCIDPTLLLEGELAVGGAAGAGKLPPGLPLDVDLASSNARWKMTVTRVKPRSVDDAELDACPTR